MKSWRRLFRAGVNRQLWYVSAQFSDTPPSPPIFFFAALSLQPALTPPAIATPRSAAESLRTPAASDGPQPTGASHVSPSARLHQPLLQARQQPVPDLLRQRHRFPDQLRESTSFSGPSLLRSPFARKCSAFTEPRYGVPSVINILVSLPPIEHFQKIACHHLQVARALWCLEAVIQKIRRQFPALKLASGLI
jgi:hypothetical protein